MKLIGILLLVFAALFGIAMLWLRVFVDLPSSTFEATWVTVSVAGMAGMVLMGVADSRD